MVDQPTLNAGRGEEPGAGRGGFAAVVKRWRWMIAIAAVAAGCIGYVIASSSTPTYNATAVLLVGPINTSDTDVLQASGQLAQTYAQLATSRPVLAATSRRVGGVQDLEQSVSASANAVTRLLTLQVSSRDPRLGARIANAEAAVLIDIATQRGAGDETSATPGTTATPTTPDGQTAPTGSGQLRVVDPAEPSTEPAGHSAVGIAIIAAVGGLLAALGLALLLDRSGDAIADLDELRAITGSGVLATVGTEAVRPPRRRRGGLRPDVERQFRLLASKLNAVGDRSLLVVVLDGDGLAFTSRLAESIVATGASVAIVDAEGGRLGATPRAVLADAPVAAGAGADGEGVEMGAAPGTGDTGRDDGVRVVRPGLEDDRHGAGQAAEVVEQLLEDERMVLVAAPSLRDSSRALTWARVVDATVLVVPLERSGRSELTAVVENLRLVHARVLGTVVAGRGGVLGT